MRIRLDHVQIAAPPDCETEARRFFGDVIGLREVEKPEPLRRRGAFTAGTRGAIASSSSPSDPDPDSHAAVREAS
jgi:catechol 2,3-dioxygenase-like lactoylglutathione lyase family enzyme